MGTLRRLTRRLARGQAGISGLETAVLLTAITLASSVFGLSYMRASLSASSQIQTGVTGVLGDGDGSLFAKAEALDGQAVSDAVDAIFGDLGSSKADAIEDTAAPDQTGLADFEALARGFAEQGVPVTMTLLADGGVSITVGSAEESLEGAEVPPGS